jgi:hypothetical protein
MTFGIILYLTQKRKRYKVVPYKKPLSIKTKVLYCNPTVGTYKVQVPIHKKYNSKKELYF